MDYLKYFKLIRFWVRIKYAITLEELELLLFLNSEKVFNQNRLKMAKIGMRWNHRLIDDLVKRGLIGQLREKPTKLYALTPHARHIINAVYRKLNGEEEMRTDPRSNPIYTPNGPYSYRRYRVMADDFNEVIKQRRRRAQESQGKAGPQSST
jgi:hypothetical protein